MSTPTSRSLHTPAIRRCAAALALALAAPAASAQACFQNDYGVSLGSANDTVHAAHPIGFAFPLDGQTYSDIHVSDHGVVWLSNGGLPAPPSNATTTYGVQLTDFVGFGPCIAAFWADANCGYVPAPPGEVFVDTSDPSRCVVTWSGMWTFPNQPPPYDLQLTLLPSGTVRVVFGPDVDNHGGATADAIVGITPGQGAALPSASDLSAGPLTTNASVFERFTTPQTFDLAADGLEFVPTSPGWLVQTLGGTSACASTTTYGDGCGERAGCRYEGMPAGNFDLAGVAFTCTRTAGGYQLAASSATWIPPGAGATVVAPGDDDEQTVLLSQPMPVPGGTTTALTIAANGIVSLGASGYGGDFTPTVADFLAFTVPAIAAMWHDFQPNAAGSGPILFEEVGGIATVTWDDVYSWGQGLGETFQVQLDLATGDITVVYDSTHHNVGNGYLVGLTVGGGPLDDPGGSDLSNALALGLDAFDAQRPPLRLTATTPVFGSTWELTTTGVDPISPIAVTLLGYAQAPGIPLTTLGIAAPGCSVWIAQPLGGLASPASGSTATLAIAVPTSPALQGAALTGQSLCLTMQNAAGLLTSNGIVGTIGS